MIYINRLSNLANVTWEPSSIINVHHSPPLDSRATKAEISCLKNGKGHLGSASPSSHYGISSTCLQFCLLGNSKTTWLHDQNTIHRNYKQCKGCRPSLTGSHISLFSCVLLQKEQLQHSAVDVIWHLCRLPVSQKVLGPIHTERYR